MFNLPGGTLRAGSIGDVTILDLESRGAVPASFVSKAANSPFIGQTLTGRVVATVVGGELRYDTRENVSGPPPRKRKSRR